MATTSIGRRKKRRSKIAGASARKAAGLTKTKKFAGKTYTKKACSKTKAGATAMAKRARKSGKAARVVKNPSTGSYCLYTRGAAKKKVA